MADDWISLKELFREWCLTADAAVVVGAIQLEGMTGNLEGRAGRAVITCGDTVVRLTDWPMPPSVWVESLSRSVRLQARGNEYKFEPLLGTLEATGHPLSALGLADLPSDVDRHLTSYSKTRISLSRIEVNRRDVEDLGFNLPADHDADDPPDRRSDDPYVVRKKPSRVDLGAWADEVGNLARDKVTKAKIAETWKHSDGHVWPTIAEAKAALDERFGKRSRGREAKSNRK